LLASRLQRAGWLGLGSDANVRSAGQNRASGRTAICWRERRRRQHACKQCRRNLKPTKPAIQISDADPGRKRKILITDKCTMAFKKWREKGESFRVDRYIEGRCLHQIMSAKTKVTKTKTALKQETYNLNDLKL
jgi:hypothetical protein